MSEIICWDASCFIDWFRGKESKNPERLPRIKSVLNSVYHGNCRLVASVLVYAEVLESRMSAPAMKTFRAFMRDTAKIEVRIVDVNIAETAMQIRSQNSAIKTPDAIHLATAVAAGAGVFHTYDNQLLSLHKHRVVNRLSITPC